MYARTGAFRRKLEALGYPLFENFDYEDGSSKSLRNMIVWLEDQKIRHYAVEERDNLRNVDADDWTSHFQTYLTHLGISWTASLETNLNDCVEWVLALAVRLEYSDNAETYNKASSKFITPKGSVQGHPSANPFDQCDFNSQEFAAGISALAKKLEICEHPDKTVMLEAIATLIKSCYNKQIVENPEKFQPKGKQFPLLDFDMGFKHNDVVMNQAAKVLRILYIEDLRDLQTKINECIVAVQTITADPQVETKLLRAGQFLSGMQKRY
jgi:RLL motif-containing protein 1